MARPKTELDAMVASHEPAAWLMAGDWCEEHGMDDQARRYRLMAKIAEKLYQKSPESPCLQAWG